MTDSNNDNDSEIERSSTTAEGLPISPSLGPSLEAADVPQRLTAVNARVIYISLLAIVVGFLGALLAMVLILLIRFLTNYCFYGQVSFSSHGVDEPIANTHLWMIGIPILGAIFIGFLKRYGSEAVAGHGIPEAMEQVLTNQSKIPPKLTFLKPFSAAISIGTGAPYGAEGPIIATGGALGSLFGQLLSMTVDERKTLLAAGAAAGIAFAFNAPIASVLLAVELLVFEFRPRSLVPIGLACVVAAMMHIPFEGSGPFFTFAHAMKMPTQAAIGLYVLIGCFIGVGSVLLTRTVYLIEHFFEHLPVHWMWHPAVGAIAVGLIGFWVPATFGSGYYNIDHLLQSDTATGLTLGAIALLGIMKFLSWTISLGSGTAGGTLAPVFTIGGALGAVLGFGLAHLFPHAGLSIGMAALVGMVGIFAGASRALMTSIVFAIETTMEPHAILPVLGGCTAAYLVSCLLMRHSIMTEKMVRQGVPVPEGYAPDFLDQVLVRDMITGPIISIQAADTLQQVRDWINGGSQEASHQGYAIVDENGYLQGVLTRRDLLNPDLSAQQRVQELIHRHPSVVYDDCTLRDAADHMVNHDVGRLPVIARKDPSRLVGMITRSDVLRAHRRRLDEMTEAKTSIRLRRPRFRRGGLFFKLAPPANTQSTPAEVPADITER